MFYVAAPANCYTAFVSASCWMFIFMAKDMKQDLNALNEIGKLQMDRAEFLGRLSRMIEFHSQAKQLSKNIL